MIGMDAARELAHSIVTTAQGAGFPARAVITDMNRVPGDSVGAARDDGDPAFQSVSRVKIGVHRVASPCSEFEG